MRALAGPLLVVAARARRGRTWRLPILALAVVIGFAGALVSEGVIVGDQAARSVLGRLDPVDSAIRLVWEGPITPYAVHVEKSVFSRLGAKGQTEVLLLNPVRLSGAIVHPVAIVPLGRWVAPRVARRLGPCHSSDCPMLLDGAAHLPATLSAAGVRFRVAGRIALSPVPLGYSPSAGTDPPVLVTGDAAGLGAIGGLSGVYRTYSWVSPLPLAHLHAWSLPGFESRLSAAQAAVSPLSARFTFEGPFAGLDAARTRASVAVHRLILADGGAIVALVLFILLAASSLRRGQAAELERLREAGAHRTQLAAFLATEAGWIAAGAIAAGFGLAVALSAILAATADEPAGAVLAHGLLSLPAAAAWAGGWAITTALMACAPLIRGRRVLDAAGLIGAAVLVAGVSLGTSSTSAWASLLVPLVCLAGGLVVFRVTLSLLRAEIVLTAARRVGLQRALSFRLALVGLGRAGTVAGVAVTFLSVSAALGGFGLAFRATLLRSVADRAAAQVPLDGLVSAGTSLLTPLQAAPLSRWRALSHGSVFPVRRTAASYAAGGGTVTIPALGVPAAALARMHGWRSSDGPEPLRTLARRLRPPGPARTPGPLLPAATRVLELATDSPDLDVVVEVDLRAATGAVTRLTLGTTGLHPRLLRARLPPGRWEAEAVEVSELSGTAITNGHQNGENPAPATQFSARLTLGPMIGLSRRDRVLMRAKLGGWRAVGAASNPPATGARASGATVALSFQSTGWPGVVRPPQPSDTQALPVLVDPSTAAAAGPGGRIGLTVDGQPVQARVVGILRRFPTIPLGAGGFVVADENLLAGALDAGLPGQGRPDELWISSPSLHALRAALPTSPLNQLSARFRVDLERALRSDPVTSGLTRTLLAIGVVTTVLALLGMLLVLVGPFRDSRVERDLEEQGLGPDELRRELRVRWNIACILGIWSGLGIALVLDRLAAATVGGYESGAIDPPLITVVPWGELVGLAAALTMVCLACGWLTSEALWPRHGRGRLTRTLFRRRAVDQLAREIAP